MELRRWVPTWNSFPLFSNGFQDLESLFDRVGQRFLAVHMLASLERRDRHVAVEVLRRHDDDGIKFGIRQHLVVVVVRVGRGPLLADHVVLALGQPWLERVANGLDRDIALADVHHRGDVLAASVSEAGPSDADLAAHCLGCEESGRCQGGSCEEAPGECVCHGFL